MQADNEEIMNQRVFTCLFMETQNVKEIQNRNSKKNLDKIPVNPTYSPVESHLISLPKVCDTREESDPKRTSGQKSECHKQPL